MSNGKIPTDGGEGLGQNPFAALSGTGWSGATRNSGPAAGNEKLETESPPSPQNPAAKTRPQKSRGRVDIRRETGGRGGKTVTVIDGFVGIGQPEKEQLAKQIRGACGCGGTVKDGAIVIQGDQRETIVRILSDAGFRPVFSGG